MNKFKELLEKAGDLQFIKKAKDYIYIQYYILKKDGIGKQLFNLLEQKLKEGVKVYNSVITENMEISENIGDKNSTSVYLVSEDGIEEE